jgi:hypothetical protein
MPAAAAKTRKKGRISKKAGCIRKTANTARIPRKFLIDSKEFSPDMYVGTTSSKYATLVAKIKELDAEDMAEHGTKFKHFIFTDIREAAYGAKAIAGFLAAGGFDFRMKHAPRMIRRGGREVATRNGMTQLIEKEGVYGGSNGFALLQSLPLWKTPLPVDTKKRILTVFNSRPDNVHGELLRIMVLDSKFKEGIDLFDVKYVHLMEPAIAASDLKQAVGRATRFCGQRGLHFVPQRGWPLQVYVYKTLLPQREPFILPDRAPLVGSALQKATNEMFARAAGRGVIESVDAHELMLAHSGLDLALLNTTKELTILAILSAVDYDLNYKINNFAAEPAVLEELEDDAVLEVPASNRGQSGGAGDIEVHDMHDMTPDMIQRCSKRKSALFPFLKSRMAYLARRLGIRAPKNAKRAWYCQALKDHPDLYEALFMKKTPPAPRRIKDVPAPPPPSPYIPTPSRSGLAGPPPSPYIPTATPPGTPDENIAYERLRELFPPPEFESTRQKTPKKLDASLDFAEFQTQIRAMYAKYAWDSPIVENGCTTSAIVAPGTPVTFTRTQDFVRHYLTPASPFKGLLAWHSVGTGKTCMAVAAATTEFERAGYTVLWVTRNALMADVYKNIFGAVCSIPIADAVRSGTAVPGDRSEQLRMLGRQWIKPISYKMFQNALEKKNDLGRQLWKNSGGDDPLRKTFLVIDEIHKLRDGDLSAAEFAEFEVIQEYIHKSFSKSGADSVRPLLMTATPISDSPGELFDILNTLIPDTGRRFMKFDEFRRRFTNAGGEINSDGRDYFQDRAKGLISYLNREYDPTTFAQPEFHTIPVPAGELAPPVSGALADMCLAGEPTGGEAPEIMAQQELDAALAALPAAGKERKKAAAAARRTYKAAISAANKTRKAHLRVCYNKQKGDYKKAAGSVQTPAIEACFSGKKAAGTKFPILRNFYAAVDSRLAGGNRDNGNSGSVGSAGAVVGAEN